MEIRKHSLAIDIINKEIPGVSRLWLESGEALEEAVRLEKAGKESEALQKIAWAQGVQHAIDIIINKQ